MVVPKRDCIRDEIDLIMRINIKISNVYIMLFKSRAT